MYCTNDLKELLHMSSVQYVENAAATVEDRGIPISVSPRAFLQAGGSSNSWTAVADRCTRQQNLQELQACSKL